jgi:hypothetical protein
VALVYLGGGYLMQVLGLTGNVHRFTNRYLTALAATA